MPGSWRRASACRGLERSKTGRKHNNVFMTIKKAHVGGVIIIVSFTAALRGNALDRLLQPLRLLFQTMHQCFPSSQKYLGEISICVAVCTSVVLSQTHSPESRPTPHIQPFAALWYSLKMTMMIILLSISVVRKVQRRPSSLLHHEWRHTAGSWGGSTHANNLPASFSCKTRI